ncbi:ABC transporter ATP-binding protein [Persicobacter psychrovividus]|uniref:Phosphonate ABC transporter ATP-binding protein n=1 Tax=Persicobacter psychrovividus TaxID=387638 RepID=A0ABN6LEK6_9BACT|nr:phosphonate ABC transporter ATP-binding protein [Persicobacter psychrovividus]
MIEVKNLSKSFMGKSILRNINGTFEQGKVNMIIGASGTGKSVLLKSIVGLYPPEEGEVLFNGRSFYDCELKMQKEIRQEIGMLFQGSALFDSKTVAQNVKFPLDMLTDYSESEKEDRVADILKRVGLEHAHHKMPSEISGGMQKRVGIARAIINNSKYLFCDEPNSGLDPQTSILIDGLIREITLEYNTTTVVVSHDMNSVLEIGDHIIFLYKGDKIWEGPNTEITKAEPESLQQFISANKLLRAMVAEENKKR